MTSVSRMVEMSEGEMVMDDRNGLSERSTACGTIEGRGQCASEGV